ncbi:hypothetical protein [Photobacterium profundum]|uniref:hypothetical protein n=1 Tax=Photobacterium TaxID=657 RepID=UPI000316BC99|nr:hypothetical protein [Photobacterium profundum]
MANKKALVLKRLRVFDIRPGIVITGPEKTINELEEQGFVDTAKAAIDHELKATGQEDIVNLEQNVLE